MEQAKSVGRLWSGSHYSYGRKVVRIRRRTAYIILTAVLLLAYAPWQLASAQANRFQALDYGPLYLASGNARLNHGLAEPSPTDKLNNLLAAWAQVHSDHEWSVALQSLDGPVISGQLNPNQTFGTASLYKLLLTYRLFSLYTPGQLAQVQINVAGRGQASLDSCVSLMLKVSDNPCGEAVGDFLGWTKSSLALKSLGLSGTSLNSASGPVSTAGDLTAYLVKLDKGELFSSAAKDYVMNLMLGQKLRAGIPAGCSGCTVANKTGDLVRVRHDTAIVSYPGGRYALSIMTNGASYSQIAQLTNEIQQLIAQQLNN